jgi:hypothetical protein
MQTTPSSSRSLRYTLPLALFVGAQLFWLQSQKSQLEDQRDACLEQLQEAAPLILDD